MSSFFSDEESSEINNLSEIEDSNVILLPHVYTEIQNKIVEQRQVLNSDEISAMHVQSASELFQAMGIQVVNYGGYGMQANPSIRGFTGSTVRVVIDGVCVNSAQNGNFDFSSLNVNDIEKLEIVRGAFTEGVTGEGSVGGTIYITTKKQSLGHNFSSDVFVKSYFNSKKILDTWGVNALWNGQLTDSTFMKATVSTTLAENAFLYKDSYDKLKEKKNSQVKDGNIHFNVNHYFGNGSSISLNDFVYAGYKNINVGNGIQQDYNNNLSFNLNIPSLFNVVSFNSTIDWICNNEFYKDDNEDSTHLLNTVIYTAQSKLYASENFNQYAGLTLDVSHLNSTNTGKHLVLSGTFKETSQLHFNNVVSVTVPLGISFSNKNIAALPKMGIKFSFQYFDIMLDAYRMVLFPTFNQLYWSGYGAHGNENLKPEEGWGGELIFNVKNNILPFSICLYTNYYKNKIKWGTDESNSLVPLNLASAFYAGADFSAERTLFNILTLKFNFEYLYNRLLDKNDASTYGKKIMWTPDITASLCAVLDLSFMSLNIDVSHVGKQYTDNTNLSEVKPYTVVNMSATCLAFNHFAPYIKVENLLNASYEAVPYYPMPLISLTAGCRANW